MTSPEDKFVGGREEGEAVLRALLGEKPPPPAPGEIEDVEPDEEGGE